MNKIVNTEKRNIISRVTRLSERSNTHDHIHHHIIFGLKGHAEFDISGVSGYLQKGVGCIVPANNMHSFFGNSENKLLILDIVDNLALIGLETGFTNNYLAKMLDTPKYFQFGQNMQQLVKILGNELENVVDNAYEQQVIGQALLNSLQHRFRNEIEVEEVSNIKERIDLQRIERYIYGNLDRKIQTIDLARLCNLSESYFYQKFHEKVGVTPYQYVIDKRIKSACSMLLKTSDSMTEICFTLGFSSQSAFTNLFRKKMGVSPREYRRQS